MIFGQPHIAGNLRHTQEKYVREACSNLIATVFYMEKWPYKSFRRKCEDITFIEQDAS